MSEKQENKQKTSKVIAKAGWSVVLAVIIAGSMLFGAKHQAKKTAREARKTLAEAETLVSSENLWDKFNDLDWDNKFKQIPDKILKKDVQRLLQKGAKIEDAPLNLFALYGKLETIQLLLDNGADINKKSGSQGYTMLHIAAETNNVYTTKFLLKQPKIDVNAFDTMGRTPLYLNLIIRYKDLMTDDRTQKALLKREDILIHIPGDYDPSVWLKRLEPSQRTQRWLRKQKREIKEDLNLLKPTSGSTQNGSTSHLTATLQQKRIAPNAKESSPKRTKIFKRKRIAPDAQKITPRKLALTRPKENTCARPGKKRV